MPYFSHGIADAFGVPDVSSCGEATIGDSGAPVILLNVIEGNQMGSQLFDGALK
jgi:hypothetical protein